MLPRWQEAFPAARSASLRALAGSRPAAAMVWLRLDPSMAVAEQIELVRACFAQKPIIVLSDMPNDDEALAAFSAAAKGYCNTHATAEVLKQVQGAVAMGGIWIGETLIHRLLGVLGHIPIPAPPAAISWKTLLTEREYEVAQTVCSGASNKEVARRLGITERTVKAHVGAVFEKLKVRDRLQLALLIQGQARPS